MEPRVPVVVTMPVVLTTVVVLGGSVLVAVEVENVDDVVMIP